ncbi:MAG TPA: adenylate/guanylate cyclase domain-containing protein [Bacteroidales bacterium]|nr:HD domain-containing protein [Bacteroidales bacterium]HNR40897.1 adenylate/guanylate cyclase domain-containing protein [Bacteroidales bacterium]HPM19011.1 adenylate/guanylate cyclase domain-containing protein [Bacteroidales bacterium]HQG78144.1 adenylate/guanylate cyclase domain-containing protein [Bacteroidales bacterium]
MIAADNEELIRRIARLARQNQEQDDLIKKLEKQIENLTRQLEKLKNGQIPQDSSLVQAVKEEAREKSLKFDMATVLFAELRCSDPGLEEHDSFSYMDELDEILMEFGAIAERSGIVKIKTIGDTFMCAGGIPEKNITNPVIVVLAAVEMKNFLDRFEARKRGNGRKIWQLKTGIHTGPVLATVTGKKKISYEIKGDTVNNASRIVTVSDDQSILISIMTCELVKELFVCEYSGRLPVKYKGHLDLFGVTGLKPGLSVDAKGMIPNDLFRIKFGLIQFTDIQEMILDKLERELPPFLFYHNVKHTVDVVTEVELIGWAEGCSDEEILLLKTAALFHDAGHIVSYDEHEMHSARMAEEILPRYNYTSAQIERICSIIMATRLPPEPADLLEEIICDSDLDYLGRSDFIPVSNMLFEELRARNKMTEINEWNKLQVKFISGHQYFTRTARSLREVNKQLQIERIRSLIHD